MLNETGIQYWNNFVYIDFVLLKHCQLDVESLSISLWVSGEEMPGSTEVTYEPRDLERGFNNLILKSGQVRNGDARNDDDTGYDIGI